MSRDRERPDGALGDNRIGMGQPMPIRFAAKDVSETQLATKNALRGVRAFARATLVCNLTHGDESCDTWMHGREEEEAQQSD